MVFTDGKTNPAYGSICFHRIASNGTHLFGSSVRHQQLVSLTISEAEAYVDDITQEMHLLPRKQIIVVEMSEAQFAELISRWNMGDGTPCTILRRPEEGAKLTSIPPLTPSKTARETFHDIADGAINRVQADITRAADDIEALVKGRLTKAQATRLDQILQTLRQNPQSNLRFAQTSVHEAVEKTVARAKVEMEAVSRTILQRLGLSGVKNAQNLLPTSSLSDDE